MRSVGHRLAGSMGKLRYCFLSFNIHHSDDYINMSVFFFGFFALWWIKEEVAGV